MLRPNSPRSRGSAALAATALAALALAALAACGDDAPPAECNAGGASAEVGSGTVEFEPLAADAELEMIAGPQGGHHFILHARMRGLDPGDPTRPGDSSNPRTQFTIERTGGEQVQLDQPPYRIGYAAGADGFAELPSGRIVPFVEDLVAELDGERLRVTVEIVDRDGACARDDAEVTAVLGPPLGAPDAGPP